MPPPPPIPCWPPLSRLELVRRSEAPPPGCPGPIGFGGPDDTIVAGNGRATNSAETTPKIERVTTHLAILSARNGRKIRQNWAGTRQQTLVTENPRSETRRNPTPLTGATSQQNPVRPESGDPELEPAPNRAARPAGTRRRPCTAARSSTATTAAAAPDKLRSG